MPGQSLIQMHQGRGKCPSKKVARDHMGMRLHQEGRVLRAFSNGEALLIQWLTFVNVLIQVKIRNAMVHGIHVGIVTDLLAQGIGTCINRFYLRQSWTFRGAQNRTKAGQQHEFLLGPWGRLRQG